MTGHRAQQHRAPRRGFTLLEVILAVSALAGLTTLVAALWSQTRDWAEENASHQAALRLDRAIVLMGDQWSSRRRSFSIRPDATAAIQVRPDRLEFVSDDSVLFPDWPFVRVSFIIERNESTLITADSRATLHYEEAPITDPTGADEASDTLAPHLAPRRVVLLADCADLRLERDVAPAPDDPRGEAAPRWTALTDGTLGVDASAASTDDPADADAPEPSGGAEDEVEYEPMRAVRIVGVYEGEPFAWPFIVAHLR